MKTKVIDINPNNIDKEQLEIAARVLHDGGTVAFPTETVYGLGANALNVEAVQNIFKAKGRPSDNPLIVHIAKTDEVIPLVQEIPEKAKTLMEHLWPGPLTMVFQKSDLVPSIITGGLDTVAIRMPSHPIARLLIEMAKVPVAAPSANLSGKPSPTEAEHVIEDLMNRVDVIIRGGSCDVGVESTVLDLSGKRPVILRPGGVTREQIEGIIGEIEVDKGIEANKDENIVPKSPGMKYTHYAPKAKVIIIDGAVENVIRKICDMTKEKEQQGLKVGIMATDETKDLYQEGIVLSVGSRNHKEVIAAKLFKTLRQFDDVGVDIILAEGIDPKDIGHAVMNRLLKAAGYDVIDSGR
ncbi:MAG: L-threonylcarbamoyladenylate synthase [Bacillota bacterium]